MTDKDLEKGNLEEEVKESEIPADAEVMDLNGNILDVLNGIDFPLYVTEDLDLKVEDKAIVLAAQEAANTLKKKERCDVVICLSHQGTHPIAEGKLSDIELAQTTRNIDIIIGAHTHKILTNHYVLNMDGDSVFLAQMGKSGARIGKIQVEILE